MRGAGRAVEMMQVVGLDPRLDEGAHQGLERCRIVVDAGQQHGLADQRNAGVDEAGAGGARGRRQLARVVGVDGDEHRLVGVAQRGDEVRRDALGRCDRHAGVPAQHLDVVDRGQRSRDLGDARRRQHQRIAARQDHLPDRGVGADVVERGGEVLRRTAAGPAPAPRSRGGSRSGSRRRTRRRASAARDRDSGGSGRVVTSCAPSPVGSGNSSACAASSATSGTNWRAIGSADAPTSISSAIAGVIATA